MKKLIQTVAFAVLMAALLCATKLQAEERITLKNGFELTCSHHEPIAGSNLVRLYTSSTDATYLDVAASTIHLVEPVEPAPAATIQPSATPDTRIPTLLAAAGTLHHIDVDLLTALVRAESAFHPQAVSRAGARGLMQLMPATAASLGVKDSFRPEQNIAGGTAYLDQLLTRFHDDIALALAAYNAGPAAVDRFHGIPPYRETRAYVARILLEYNRRKKLTPAIAPLPPVQ